MAVSGLAAAARVPVLALAAPGWAGAVQDLRLHPALRVVLTPRAATVLLLAGPVAEEHADAAARVHDQLPGPRATVCWGAPPPERFTRAVQASAVARGDDAVATIVAVHRGLLSGALGGEPTLLPDEPPHPWRGRGPFGQGGEGMMGGYPYGRAMAMTADDRDGLALDALSLRVGPWLPGFPPGLVLDVTLQGDVVQAADVVAVGGAEELRARDLPGDDVLVVVRDHLVSVDELETARVRARLRRVADMLALCGLDALGRRALRLAAASEPAPRAVARFARWLAPVLGPSTAGIGVVVGDLAAAVGGPVARAAGHALDVRSDDPAYGGLGFAPVTQHEGDARARWRQYLAEASQSAELAARARRSGVRTGPHDAVAAVWAAHRTGGPARLVEELPALLVGTEWGTAVTTIASLDLSLDAGVPASAQESA